MQEITRETYGAEVLRSSQPVVVDFWGPRCVPCQQLLPIVERLDQELGQPQGVKTVKVNAQQNRMLCVDTNVRSLPTFLLISGGVEVQRLTGDVSIASVQQLFRDAVALSHNVVADS